MLVIAIWTTDRAVLIPVVIVSGIFIGVNNTITTQAVMTVSLVKRPGSTPRTVLGVLTHGGLPALMDASASRELWRHARSNVLIINPEAPVPRAEPVREVAYSGKARFGSIDVRPFWE